MAQGLDVFRNLSPEGPADLVARDRYTGRSIAIDVKSQTNPYRKADGTTSVTLKKLRRDSTGVHQLVIHAGEIMGFVRGENGNVEHYWPFDEAGEELAA